MVITGGGAGIMAAAHEGAGLEHSLGFNITLPFEQRANPTIHDSSHLLAFHFFFTRKLFLSKKPKRWSCALAALALWMKCWKY